LVTLVVACVSVIAPQVDSPLIEFISNIQKLGLSIPLAPNNGKILDVFDILSLVDDIQCKSPLSKFYSKFKG